MAMAFILQLIILTYTVTITPVPPKHNRWEVGIRKHEVKISLLKIFVDLYQQSNSVTVTRSRCD